jgi:Sec-independent protein translocase protein TatA
MFVSEIFGPDVLVVIIVGAVLLFGGASIPKFARHLGQSKSEFERGMKSVSDSPADARNADVASSKGIDSSS